MILLYNIIEKFSDTSLLAEKNGTRYILKRIQPAETEVYNKLLGIRNENIANIIDIVESGGELFAVREYISGLPLEEYIFKFGSFCDEDIRSIIGGICDGLSVIHSLGIVHRDITPANILIDENGMAKIIDFGISRITKPDRPKDTEILGTAGYAAPEQFGFAQTTGQADIYSIGVLINFMAEGVLPGEHLTNGRFRKIVLKCIQIDSAKRYRNTEEIKRELGIYKSENNILRKIPGIRSKKKAVKISASIYYIIVVLAGIGNIEREGLWLSLAYTALLILPVFIGFDFDYFTHRLLNRAGVGRRGANAVCIITALVVFYFFSEIILHFD